MNEILSGIQKQTPLICADTLIDLDMGLINLVLKEYWNDNVFELHVNRYMELINMVYYRDDPNPLYVLMKDEKYRSFLDGCYLEFTSTKEEEIIQNVISTGMVEACQQFRDSGEVRPTIVYFSDYQLDGLLRIPNMHKIPMIHYRLLDPINNDIHEAYSDIFVKSIEELLLFPNLHTNTIYVSSCGINIDYKERGLRKSGILEEARKQKNSISVFDMYRHEIIGKDPHLI